MSYLFGSISLELLFVLLLSAVIVTSIEHTAGNTNIFGSGWYYRVMKYQIENKNFFLVLFILCPNKDRYDSP